MNPSHISSIPANLPPGAGPKALRCLLAALVLLAALPSLAHAYIGPGAGFAVVTSFFILFISFFLSILMLFFWPVRLLFRLIFRRGKKPKGKAKRVIIVGFDGFDPELAASLMAEGKLPHLADLKEKGTFSKLQTTTPAISPVAWSTFMTGVNPGKHNIFDFLDRDAKTYLPNLSSARIENPRRRLTIGKYSIPLGKPSIVLMRKSRPFWSLLGERGIFSTVLRVPITFPPEKFNGLLLSGMCVPDLKGTQGTFSFYTSKPKGQSPVIGGQVVNVEVNNGRVRSEIVGPANSILKEPAELKIPFSVELDAPNKRAILILQGRKIELKPGDPTGWLRLTFSQGLGFKVHGICRFLLRGIEPDFEMYVSPIHIDPEKPALPISEPFVYSMYLAKLLGPYATLGLAEDTWALNEGAIDDDGFLEQCYRHHAEREAMFESALSRLRSGLLVTVFDTSDRIQHMFWRYTEPGHPARSGGASREQNRIIEAMYVRLDALVGKIKGKLGRGDVLIVLSDHGFKSFERGISLNSWLYENGYLALKDGKNESGEWFQDVDWERTKAYAMGLGGLFLNRKGREAKGVVGPEEAPRLKKEIAEKLEALADPGNGKRTIVRVHDRDEVYKGPYVENGPDLIVGYEVGYRASWDSVTGKVGGPVFEANTKCWSGDHCIEPARVPGVFFSNWKCPADHPGLLDMAPTVLRLLGVEPPAYMDGKSLALEPPEQGV